MELFRPDEPVSSEAEDHFQRYPFAKRIAQIVSTGKYPKSLVVGLYGKWGEGKTSVMNFVQNELQKETVAIKFNPWLFNDQKQLLKSFFETIAYHLGRRLTTNTERAAKVFEDYADSVGSLADLVIPYGIGVFFGLGKKLSAKLKRDSIEDLKKKVDDLIIEANTNFVIFIDDIDRLDISEVQAVFKLVKLVGDFPRTSYILSFDDDMVASALGPQYANRDTKSGYEFLEKIIQIPLHIPKANKQALRAYTVKLIDNVFNQLRIELSKKEIGDFMRKFDSAFLPAITNPRLGVRFANSIGFSIPLLIKEVNISDLIVIEGIKVFFPELYHFIRSNPKYFTANFSSSERFGSGMNPEEKEAIKLAINEKLKIYAELERKILSMVMDLFPQLKTLYQNHFYNNDHFEQWYREQRICSPHYFERYFSYVVIKGEISDAYFKGLIEDLNTVSTSDLIERFKNELPKLTPGDFIFKLQRYVPDFKPDEVSTLAKALAYFGEYFSVQNPWEFFGPKDHSTFVIAQLLQKIPKEQRFDACLEVLKISKPFPYTMEIERRFRVKPVHVWDEAFLSDEEIKKIEKYLVERAMDEYKKESIFDLLPDYETARLLEMFVNSGRDKEAQQLILNALQMDRSNSIRVIKIFTPTVHSSSVAYPYKANFSIKSYE